MLIPRPRLPILSLLLAALALISLGSCSKTRTPSSGNTAPSRDALRIVSLSPAAADILRDLGFASSLVGRNSADVWTDRSVPSCGELGRIDYEALIAARPTHVFVQEATTPPRLEQLGRDHGWRVENLSLLTLDEIRTSTRRIVESLPASAQPAASTQLARIEREMDQAWSPAVHPSAPAPVKVMLLASVDPPAALGPGSFHVQILQRLGGTNLPRDGSPYITLSAEDIIAMSPDAIILILPRDPAAPPSSPAANAPQPGSHDTNTDHALAALGVLGTLDIPAIRRRRVALIDDPKAHLPSTAMIGLADEMRRILIAWDVATGP